MANGPSLAGIRIATSCSTSAPSAGSMRKSLASDGEFFVEDLHSRNGTFVNGEAIQAPASACNDGDRLKICDLASRSIAISRAGKTVDRRQSGNT